MKTDPNEKPLDGTAGKKKPATVREILSAQMFAVTSHEAEFLNLNTRSEKHGEEDKPAADVKMAVTGPHSLIECFGDALRDFLFRVPGVGEDKQTSLDLGGDKRIKVRYPRIKPVALTDEFPGYTVILSPGIDAGEVLTFKGAKLKGFQFRPIDGGAVEVTLTASVYPDGHQAGVLFEWQRKTLVLTLERPKAAGEAQKTLN